MAKKPDPIDIHVGKNIRIFRLAKGLSQSELGDAIGVTFQQVQKYEKGTNRVGSSRIVKLAIALGVPVNRLFSDGGKEVVSGKGEIVTDLLAKPYAIRMLKALANIPNNKTRLLLVELTESIVQGKYKTTAS
jgi:transcriptional regulator with XRE-family HTH domain